jgi:hypothetical protein
MEAELEFWNKQDSQELTPKKYEQKENERILAQIMARIENCKQ